jgi:methionine-rich copper-binding protein CopC
MPQPIVRSQKCPDFTQQTLNKSCALHITCGFFLKFNPMKKPFRFFSSRHFVVCVSTAIALSMLGTQSSLAHAQLIKCSPQDKAELKEPPKRVEFWFNELLEDGFNSVEIVLAAELNAKHPTNFARGQPKVDSADRTHLKVGLSVLKPGRYIVRYRVLSRDGHSAPGQLTFRVLDVKP